MISPRGSTQPFQMYAYGPGIGGLSIFSSGGNAFIGDYQSTNQSQAAPVIITPAHTGVKNGSWIGNPNTTRPVNSIDPPTWSNREFAIPGPESSSNQVGFVTAVNDTSNTITSGFRFYGNVILLLTSDGKWESLWSAVPTAIDDVYLLQWNVTDGEDSNQVPLVLKRTPPSNS
ncbi:hypothetical protein MAC_08488 [Metarhizium acridum CQMa 102]|uniref:Uncharacterized protein n=1 Tax=Metarhizium acridum (strain CQMa 102) TaxID=655827 RepID=E9EF40_METAQ|nr:uncharacterized protein MAC_08488 [Metarhizium acridum CQMa 102]EFY85485.1 hypothetical protein MAC_08488 [Metarhizium acridum CQMa 102]